MTPSLSTVPTLVGSTGTSPSATPAAAPGSRRGGAADDDERVTLARDEVRVIGEDDVVELYAGVNVGRARMWANGGVSQPSSVMSDAPTMAIRKFER